MAKKQNSPETDLLQDAGPLGDGLDVQDPDVAIALFRQAAEASLNHPLRQGSAVHLPSTGELIMTGDLHDHVLNLRKIAHYADLENHPDRHVILHELIHGGHTVDGRDMSVRTLARAAAYKIAYPQQVHIMAGNHELAQLGGEGIMKGGLSVVEVFDDGVEYIYGDAAESVLEAMNDFIRAMLLAVKCANGVFCSHSLPSPRMFDSFDPTIIDRIPTEADLKPEGSAYHLVWGRNHTEELAEDLADEWGVNLFVMGHQPVDAGYYVEGESMLILASDDNHGVIVPIDLTKRYTMDSLVDRIVYLAGIVL